MSSVNTSVEMSAQEATSFLTQVAEQSFGSKAKEGVNGGNGSIGMIGGKPVKFNTHWQERVGKATPEMIKSSNELRESLGAAAKALCSGEAQNDKLAAILDKLGLDANGSAVGNTDLLSRKVAAQVLHQIDEMRGGDSFSGVGPTSSKGIDTKFSTRVRLAVDQMAKQEVDRFAKRVAEKGTVDKMLARQEPKQPKGLDFTFEKMLALDTHNQDPNDMVCVNGKKGAIFGIKMTKKTQERTNLIAKHLCEETILAEMAKLEHGIKSQFEKDVDREHNLLPNGDLLSNEHKKFKEQRLEIARQLLKQPKLEDINTLSDKDRRKVHLVCSLLNQELSKGGLDCFCAAFDSEGRFDESPFSFSENGSKESAGDLHTFRTDPNGDIVLTHCRHRPAISMAEMMGRKGPTGRMFECEGDSSNITHKVEVRIPAAEVDRLTSLDWTISKLDVEKINDYHNRVEKKGLLNHSTSEEWTKQQGLSDYHPGGIQVSVAIEININGTEMQDGQPV